MWGDNKNNKPFGEYFDEAQKRQEEQEEKERQEEEDKKLNGFNEKMYYDGQLIKAGMEASGKLTYKNDNE